MRRSILILTLIITSATYCFSQTNHNYDNYWGGLYAEPNTRFIGVGSHYNTSGNLPLHQLEIHGWSSNTTLGANSTSAFRINNNTWSYNSLSEIQFGISNGHNLSAISSLYKSYGSHASGDLIFSTSPPDEAAVMERVRITDRGNVGIGVTNPTARLQLTGNSQAWPMHVQHEVNSEWQVSLGIELNVESGLPSSQSNNDNLNRTTPFKITRQTDNGYDLLFAIRGDGRLNAKKIYAEEIEVNVNALSIVPDYVFEDDYKIMSLEETEAYYKEHKHLPEVPSAKEMVDDGMNLMEMNLILLKKIEELTIQVVELEKKVNQQQ